MRLELTDNGSEVQRDLRELANRLHDPAEALEQFGQHMVEQSLPKTFRMGGRPNSWARSKWQTSGTPQHVSGRILRSNRHELAGRGGLRIGTNLRHAQQRHDGGTIKARAGKALVVPLPNLPKSMRRPSRWGKRLFKVPSHKADTKGILATSDGRGGFTPRFVLRKQVTQPARPWLIIHDEDYEVLRALLIEHAGGDA